MRIKPSLFVLLSMLTTIPITLSARQIDITILGTSDVHGRMIPWNYATDKADNSGSYAQISTLIDEYRNKNTNTIIVDAGDIIQDNQIEQFYNLKPHPAIVALNTMNYDIIVPGNHEFNFGTEALKNIIGEFNGVTISTNIYDKNSGERFVPAATIIEKQGVKIGFIGATTPFVPEFEAKTGHVDSLIFTMPIADIQKQVDKLIEQHVDAIVLIAHMGLDNENNRAGTGVADIAQQVKGLDVIIAGHNHQNISEKVVNGVIITEPHRYGTVVSVVQLKFNEENGKIELVDKTSKTIPVNDYPADPTIDAIYAPYHNILREQANQVIGETDHDLVPQTTIGGIPAVYMQDSGLTSLFNDVQLYYSKADVTAILIDNKKAILDKGQIKRKDIANNYQYTGGETSIFEMSGKELKAYMEWSAGYFAQVKQGDKNYQYDAVRGASKYMTYDMFGGVTYTIDLKEPVGYRIKNLKLTNGTVITDNSLIKVGMNAYRYEMLVKTGGPLAGHRVAPIWDSKTAFGQEEGTIRNMVIKYITDVKLGKVDGVSHNNWQVVGLEKNGNDD